MNEWIMNNWPWLLALIVSELLPYLPIEANGITQAAVNILKRIATRTGPALILCLLILASALTGCQTVNLNAVCGSEKGSIKSADSDTPQTTTSLQGNVPLYGGTVNNPQHNN